VRFRKYVILADRCKNCGACMERCPESAIERTSRDVCEIHEAKCSCCGVCMKVCKAQAIKDRFSLATLFRRLIDPNERKRIGHDKTNERSFARVCDAHK